MNYASHRRGFLLFEFIVGIMQTVSKQYQCRLDAAENAVFTRFSRHFGRMFKSLSRYAKNPENSGFFQSRGRFVDEFSFYMTP